MIDLCVLTIEIPKNPKESYKSHGCKILTLLHSPLDLVNVDYCNASNELGNFIFFTSRLPASNNF